MNDMNGTNQDSSHNFQTELPSITPLNETNDGYSSLAQKSLPTIYYYYPYSLLLAGAICCIILSVAGTTGNLISILALLKKKKLRNATTAFIVNLCVADMIYCSFTMPLTAITFVERDWNYSKGLCKAFALAKFSNALVSFFTIGAITVNRYVLIVHPNRYRMIYKKRNTAIMIFCLWICPLALIFLPLFDVWGTLKYNPNGGDCGVYNLNGKSPRVLIIIVVIILPTAIIVACYTKIYIVVKKAVRKSRGKKESGDLRVTGESSSGQKNEQKVTSVNVYLRDKKEYRVLRIVLVIFFVYILTTFPIALLKLFRKEKDWQVMTVIAYLAHYSSSVVNPIIYIIMSREYRTAYKELFLSSIRNQILQIFTLSSQSFPTS